MKSTTIALLLALFMANAIAKSAPSTTNLSGSTDTVDLSSVDDANALSKLSLATDAGKETGNEEIGYDFDRPGVYDESNSEVMPLDVDEPIDDASQKADDGSVATSVSTSSSESERKEDGSENSTINNDETLPLEDADESASDANQHKDRSESSDNEKGADEQKAANDESDSNEQPKDAEETNDAKQQKAITKDDLLRAITTYRDNLQRMVGARGVLNSVNLDLVKFQQRENKYNVSVETVVNGVINAATTLRDFFDSYDAMLSNSELDELKEYISSSLNDAGYRYHSEVSKLYESGLGAITSQKRKAKQVERDASALRKQLSDDSIADDGTNEKMTRIKDVILSEQQELKSLKNSTKSLLNSLASFKTKMDSATSIDKLRSLIDKSKQLVQTHVEYLQSIKEKFIETEGSNAKKLEKVVNDISSKASSAYAEAKGVYKKTKSAYKDAKHSLAGK